VIEAPSERANALARRAPLLAATAALVAHLPALGNRYALDDAAILANPAIASWRSLPGALAAPWWYDTRPPGA
jgi:hypothetical protein